jgi:hypothetical protein
MTTKSTFILIFVPIFFLTCNSAKIDDKNASLSKDLWEENYPWRESTTKAAVNAINTSINNLLLDKESRNENFPADPGPFNVAFNQSEREELAIIGFIYTDSSPDIYEIEFRPEQIKCCDNRITVKINIQTNEVFMVFMKPDA